MMPEMEIKYEFEKDQEQCRTCLSVGRKLSPLGEYIDIYQKLLTNYDYLNNADIQQLQICWECRALLQKISQFQNRVQRANEMLQIGQSYMYGTLSNLTSVILNDTHPSTIYVNTLNIQTDKQIYKESDTECNDDLLIMNEENFVVQDGGSTKDVLELKTDNIDSETKIQPPDKKATKIVNKWAKKRALQNKKPKFKIITNNELKCDETFRKVQIDVKELGAMLESERDSECFKRKRFKCETCVLGYKSENSLAKHNKSHHMEDLGQYICDICSTRMPHKRHLSSHISNHYYKYECGLCHFTCYKKKQRLKHINKEHRKMFQCLKCELKFGARREFFKHFKEWHEKFTCDHCGISFKMRYCIKDHIRKQHSPIECKECGKRFARYNGLWLHNKVRHTPAAAAAYCVECDKRYADVYRYRWHLANSARHTPRKRVRIPCPGCDKVFSKNIYMKDHYNLVHLKYYKYRCEECDKNFIRNADLVKHRRRVHEGILPPKNKICYMCGRGFSTNKILTNHLRTHTGERPFACSQCPARFAQSTALAGHTRALHHKQWAAVK